MLPKSFNRVALEEGPWLSQSWMIFSGGGRVCPPLTASDGSNRGRRSAGVPIKACAPHFTVPPLDTLFLAASRFPHLSVEQRHATLRAIGRHHQRRVRWLNGRMLLVRNLYTLTAQPASSPQMPRQAYQDMDSSLVAWQCLLVQGLLVSHRVLRIWLAMASRQSPKRATMARLPVADRCWRVVLHQ